VNVSASPFFVFVASDIEDQNGHLISGAEVWDRRFQRGIWPLYRRTPNSKVLKAADRVLFYVGGTGSVRQSFVGEGVIEAIVDWNHMKGEVDAENWMTTSATSAVVLGDRRRFPTPVMVKPLLDKLACAPANRSRWGVLFHGGVRKFSHADGAVIRRAAKTAADTLPD
tara:strand:- start:95 stop:598 length:504 start_codon:yes stop_codon:yes gene_type:complete